EAHRRVRVGDDGRLDIAARDELLRGGAVGHGRRIEAGGLGDIGGGILRDGDRGSGCIGGGGPGPDDAGEGRDEQDRARDDERLAAQLRADLALGDEPDGGARAEGGGGGGGHWMTSLKIWARVARWGAKLATSPSATARRRTRSEVSSTMTSKTA